MRSTGTGQQQQPNLSADITTKHNRHHTGVVVAAAVALLAPVVVVIAVVGRRRLGVRGGGGGRVHRGRRGGRSRLRGTRGAITIGQHVENSN